MSITRWNMRLLQSGQLLGITKWDKVRQLFFLQIGTILLQSGTGITR